jgi:hypothetical protein
MYAQSVRINSSRFIYFITFITLLGAYIRLYFGLDVTDESYHVAASLLTALGAKFFINDSQIGQSASLVYEPIMYLYHSCFGNFGVILFVRHLYFLLALICFYTIYRLLRKSIAPDLAFLISALIVVFSPYPSPTLGYNTIGSLFFGIGAALTINSVMSNRLALSLLGGWAFAVCVFAYPAFGLGIIILYIGLLCESWTNKKFARAMLIWGAMSAAILYLIFWGITSYRFGFDAIIKAAHTTQLYGSGTLNRAFLEYKIDFFKDTLAALAPPWWGFLLLIIFLLYLKKINQSWTWSIFFSALLFLIFVPAPLSESQSPLLYIAPMVVTLIFCVGVVHEIISFRNNYKCIYAHRTMILTSAIMGIVCFVNSSTQIIASALGTRLGLIFILSKTATQGKRAAMTVPICALYLALIYYSFTFSYREELLSNMSTFVTTGPFAGILTSDFKAAVLNHLENDLLRTSMGAESIVSYDNFPAGFLMTDLRPATRSLFIHPLPYGHWDRADYTIYYENVANRPDIVLQMEIFPYAKNSFSINRNEWTHPPTDTFFDYLPLTGDYNLVQIFTLNSHVAYRIWRKKNLSSVEVNSFNYNLD